MISKKIRDKIIQYKKLDEKYEKLDSEIKQYLEKKYPEIVEFDNGDRIGNIISFEKIPKNAQDNEDGTYTTYYQKGEDWGSGTIYIPLNNGYGEYLEIYYST